MTTCLRDIVEQIAMVWTGQLEDEKPSCGYCSRLLSLNWIFEFSLIEMVKGKETSPLGGATIANVLQKPRAPLEKLRGQELSKHREEANDSGAIEIALQNTSLFSPLPFFSRWDIGYKNISIQISNLPCVSWMFASYIYGKKKKRKLEKRSDNVRLSSSDAWSIIYTGR